MSDRLLVLIGALATLITAFALSLLGIALWL
jgi:hypothetical protein